MARRKRWPSRVRLDGLWWRIEYVPEGHEKLRSEDGNDDNHLMGTCVEWERTIWICATLDDETKKDTLFHECVHALYRTYAGLPNAEPITGDSEHAEEAVVKFATRCHWILADALKL